MNDPTNESTPSPPTSHVRNPYAPPAALAVEDESAIRGVNEPPPFPWAAQLAGILFGVRALFGFAEIMLGLSSTSQAIAVAVVDLFVGVGLLTKSPWAQRWGLLRSCVGAVIGAIAIFGRSEPWMGVLQLLACLGLLALLYGEPRKPRFILGCVLFALFAVPEAVGLALALARG